MEKAKDIKEELLKQMEGYSIQTTDLISSSSRTIIETYKKCLERRKWIAVTSWLITLLYALGIHNLKVYVLKHNIADVLTREEFWLIRFSDLTTIVMIIISILLTYLVFAKSKTLTLLQICARLDSIEEQLKKISQDKSPT